MRRHHPGVDAQLRDAGRPFREVGRAPVDIADSNGLGVRQTDCPPAEFVSLGHQRPRVGQQRRARGSEAHRPAVTIEQIHLEITFERLDLLRQGRPGDVQTVGGAAEIQLIGNGDEVPQLP
ncbi:hypothetical protein MAUB_25500 [Mycolicibacterium aubagnense]|uniref:Uncharacterized protein n=1 Tax=Mycolicibacterium aubagnense TaxID=319707 RepID=A0ABN5YSE2_9MYCO|nr:hypothetical protein MAUB_25500 [Mycolicibacterium aubagnense]